MSQDQRPARPAIVVSGAPRALRPVAGSAVKAAAADASPSLPVTVAHRPPALLLGGLFIGACTGAGVGLALLPWLIR